MWLVYLRRGMLAGLLAGLIAGTFAFLIGEPLVDKAIALEHTHGGEVFSRGTQKMGLLLATTLYGVSVGGIFGLFGAYFKSRTGLRDEWSRSLALSGVLFTGAILLPFLKYPANPPTVGDPATIGFRTSTYLAMVGLSLLTVYFAWRLSRKLGDMGTPARHLAIGGFIVAVMGMLLVLLPPAQDPGEFPAGLLWSFRLASLGTQAVFWASLGVLFGLLGERAVRKTA